ncbi:MAG: STAS domain-containing protein, partial [Saprospiraceae bacterium]|nr:STAS domain-containing protein [Saprospiraceae bacterium]
HIDSTGVDQLKLLRLALDKQEIKFLISGLKGPVRDLFNLYQLEGLFPIENRYLNIQSAIDDHHGERINT